MRLLSIFLARSIWFCPLFDLNPKGKNLSPIIPLLIDRYKFKRVPSLTEIPDFSKGVKFEEGEFKSSEGNEIALNFTVYNDGLVVDTRSSTKDSDAFLVELLTRLSKDFDFPHYEPIIRNRNYLSQIYISIDKSLELINPKLREVSKYLTDNLSPGFEIGSIIFLLDPAMIIPATLPNSTPFTIERAINIPFAENRYYSSSGLQTEKHLELLQKVEDILS